MASRQRASGFLHDRVLRLLKAQYPRVLTGLGLVELLLDEGEAVPASQVYRALRRLIDAGAARKVLVAGGYVPTGDAPAVLLWCRDCRKVEEVPCAGLVERLAENAVALGFQGMRSAVEVPGLCAACAERKG